MRRINTIHFVGIGGSGMSGIAEVLLNLGYARAGLGPARERGDAVARGLGRAHHHRACRRATSRGADVVVVSGRGGAREPGGRRRRSRARVPVVARAEMLAELMRFRYSIAVAGTHGKTTTTSLRRQHSRRGRRGPDLRDRRAPEERGSNARLGAGRYLVAEADESDASFTHLQPLIAIVTNIDNDHLGTHGGDFGLLKQSFVEFLHNLPFYGLAVLCLDDEHVRGILPRWGARSSPTGSRPGADVRAINIRAAGPADALRRAARRSARAAAP